MFINWMIMLSTAGTFFFLLFLILIANNNMVIFEYFLFSIQNLDVKFYFLFDWMSTSFSSIVLLISGMVILYSNSYMKEEKNKFMFCYMVLLFVLSMVLLILMPNMFMVILGWDGLGLVSYCLVIYYQSVNSFNSGMITILSNRIGDVMIIISMIFFVSFGSFDMSSISKVELIFGIMILIAGLTKSAQIPFSAWLPAAMAAPTPVSSLVHSSTLVTAGVYLFMRFNILFKMNVFSMILMKISLLTLLMSGINAFFETDFKKIIAFSTLSQLSMMMIMISLNFLNLAFFHLIIHAIFKSMLFLCAGIVIHSFQGIQDIRMLGSFFSVSPLISSCMMISMLSLMGFPFVGGFYSKDLILEFFFFKTENILMNMIFLLGIAFTFLYCCRLIFMLMIKSLMDKSMIEFKFDFNMMFPVLFLTFLLLVVSSSLMWLMNPYSNLIFINKFSKIMILTLLIVFPVVSPVLMKLKKFNKNFDFCISIWYLTNMTSFIFLKNFKNLNKISMSDWTWMENFGPLYMKKNMFYLFNTNYWINSKNLNKILLTILLLVFIFIL
uniref:NADH dehydrogenase subunit 5 n=1 Tax=Amblyomma boeroi TaxID=575970 RepID=UPI002E79200C|nr:NADH dehydrogenase subunit 5 [Amblyomma boeroi]WQF68986.1 NADH dehydrogenase subunit 5 [Amblyomma boeroi]